MRVKRRDFLGAGAGMALLFAGGARGGAGGYDVIVIGGGTSGIPTALFAAQRGARVLVLEKASALGGTLFWSSGQIAGAGTVFQQRLGIEDSPEAHFADCMRINRNSADPTLTRLTVDHAGETINWLARHGYEVLAGHPVTGIGHDHFKTRRYQQGVDNGLSILNAFLPSFQAQVDAGRIEVRLGTEVVDLIQDRQGAVRGVVSRDPNHVLRDIEGRSIVLATGGCAANPRLFEELHGVPLYAKTAYPTSMGAGLILGLAAGGQIRGGDKYASLPGLIPADHQYPTSMHAFAPLHPEVRQPWEILVNARGERFVQEDHPSVDHIEHGIVAQPGQRHWAIYDAKMLAQSPPIIPKWDRERLATEYLRSPMFTRADNLTSLGLGAQLDPRVLSATVARYNEDLAAGNVDQFGRVHRPLPIVEPPFYAIEMQGWTLVSFAGLTVDGQLRVLDKDQQPIPNLYALGEVIGAGATSGNAYTNGMLVTPAITFGRILGQSILPLGSRVG